MVETVSVLGLDLASTAPLFLVVLGVHILAAVTAIVTGLLAMLARKGSHRHTRAGDTYLVAILAVFVTACVMTAFRWITDYPLLIAGAIGVVAAIYGYWYRRVHRPGDTPHIVAMSISYIAMLTAFYVDNGPNLPIWNLLPAWTFWFLPAIVGTPLVFRAVRRGRRVR